MQLPDLSSLPCCEPWPRDAVHRWIVMRREHNEELAHRRALLYAECQRLRRLTGLQNALPTTWAALRVIAGSHVENAASQFYGAFNSTPTAL